MTRTRLLFISILGVGAIATGFVLHNHVVNVRAAKLEKAVAPAPYFPAGSMWTKDVSHAPVDPQSSTIISWLAGAGGWGYGRMQIDFNIRVLQANANTSRVPFRQGGHFYGEDSDHVSSVPLPPGGGMEGQSGYQCNIHESDCHFIVVDRSHAKLYEAYEANVSDGALYANGIVVWDLNRIYPPSERGDQCSSVDASGMPIAPLLFNADELAVGHINHALRFALPNQRIRASFFVHPATHIGGPRGPVTAPPMGAHFRLKSTFDMSKLSPAGQVVARALQKYGMYLSDGGNAALTAQNDRDTQTKYADLDFDSHALTPIKVTDFEVLDLGTPIKYNGNCRLHDQ